MSDIASIYFLLTVLAILVVVTGYICGGLENRIKKLEDRLKDSTP